MASTSDLAGALAAIEARLAANWTTTRIAYVNIEPNDPWPPVNENGSLVSWIYVEVDGDGAEIHAFGTPLNQTVIDTGDIRITVFVPKGEGLDQARAHAVALGEIFRQQLFYNSDPTAYVRSGTPRIDGGIAVSDDGNWVTMTTTVPFEFYHRA